MITYESQYYGTSILDANELYHHGIKGQKWGVRRFQDEDGSLTAAGKQRYSVGDRLKAARDRHEDRVIARYQKKESKKLDKNYGRQLKRSDRQLDLLKAAYEGEVDKGSRGSDRAKQRIGDAFERESANNRAIKNMMSVEHSKIMSAKISDIKEERRVLGLRKVALILNAVSAAEGGPYSEVESRSSMTNQLRLTSKEREDIVKKSQNEGKRDRELFEKKYRSKH